MNRAIEQMGHARTNGRITSKRWQWMFLWGMVAVLTLSSSMPGCGDSANKGVTEPSAGAAAAEAKTDKSAEQDDTSVDIREHGNEKILPDVSVRLGSPQTQISLDELMSCAEAGFFKESAPGSLVPKVIERIDGKKVVEASIQRNQLVLDWVEGKTGEAEITIRISDANDSTRVLDSKVQVTVWEADYKKLIMTVIGGLGIFLLGMKNMSEGLQAVAGAGLRRMIAAVTDNRLMATGVGAAVTCLIQSSSITTVMVVGFVNSGFMNLSQAVGVIMGANIGTTITGWILAMKVGKFGLPILGAAAFIYLFSKRDRLRFVAMAVMGLGMVFFGLELMKNGFAVVKNLAEFEAWFKSFDASTYPGVLKCAAVGCLVTLVVQSSSATLGITIGLAATGVIDTRTACALVLGENVGTTITALLASLGATVNARRAAYFHAIFNILGVAWVTAIFTFAFFPFIEWLAPTVEPFLWGIKLGPELMIATTHTVFNVTNTLLFLPFARKIAALLSHIGRSEEGVEKPHLTSLDIRMLETSAIAVEQSRVEVLRMANGCKKMADWIKEINSRETPDDELVQKTFHREEVLDVLQDEIVAFMASLLSGNVPLDVTEEARRQLRMADEYESISDYLVTILKSNLQLGEAGQRFSEDDREKLLRLHDMVAEYLELIYVALQRRQADIITKAHSQGDAITLHVKKLRDQFLAKMSEERLDPRVIVAYTFQLNSYRRVREHALNIAEALAGEK